MPFILPTESELKERKISKVDPENGYYVTYTRPRDDRTLLAKNQFVYDEYYDCYLCPKNQPLHFSTLIRKEHREYKSKSYICQNCPQLKQCTSRQSPQNVVTRHIWQAGLKNAEHLRSTPFNRETYRK